MLGKLLARTPDLQFRSHLDGIGRHPLWVLRGGPFRLEMMKDPYQLLKVRRNADPEAIKLAYRKLAKKLHPDQNPGDHAAEQSFKDLTQAYNLLSDPKKRRDFDRGRLDADGRRRPPSSRQSSGTDRHDGGWRRGLNRMVHGVLDKLGGITGTEANTDPVTGSRRSSSQTRSDRSKGAVKPQAPDHRLEVDFQTALLGGKQRINLAHGKTIEIDVPPGSDDNTMLRLKGQGRDHVNGEGNGDLVIALRVVDHRFFTRRGQDLYLDVPISFKEAIHGGRVYVPTLEGAVWLNIPAHANSDQTLRLKGKGGFKSASERGDQYVRLVIMLPKEPDAAMAADLERLAERDDRDVRSDLDWF